ncbi:hypothetical protein GCM10011506_05710 [Marivirga lumbricoides]|uniref:TonB-dependent receptor n=1 Tax=Marivirga lumbricoides TaxID=1046115 RepID=A0ABQ1LDY8_9BACT|nr:hypothetical protein GCM10011506_05710 [Marivirga lumbricoides]
MHLHLLFKYSFIIGLILALIFAGNYQAYGSNAVTSLNNSLSFGILDTKVNISCQSCSMEEVLRQLEEASSTKFIYSQNDIRGIKFESLSYSGRALGSLLNELLSPYDLTYKVMNDRVIIKKEKQKGTGTIKGKVYDQKDENEVLPGASIRIEGTTKGTVTNVNGLFEIENLPEGTYTLIVSFVGYATQQVEGIKVIEGNETVVNVPLGTSTTELSEVVVKADIPVQYAPIRNSTEISLLSSMKADIGVVTGISNQQISRSLDRDAADVVKRVPGITILNNFVLIRGLSQRYTMTYINGMLAPSTEEDQRAFSFNLLPSGLIDNIMVYKSPSPELPAGFAGGIVKISTKQPNVARRLQLSISGQYREGTTFNSGYTNSGASQGDWLGLGLEDRKYADNLYTPTYKFPDRQFSPAALSEVTLNFPKPYDLQPLSKNISPDLRARLNYYDSWKLGGQTRINNLTSIGYTGQTRFITGETNGDIVPQATAEQALEEVPSIQATDSLYAKNVRISVLQSLNLNLNDNHSIGFTAFYNRSVDDETNIRDEKVFSSNNSFLTDRVVNYEYSVQDLLSAQLSGTHTLGIHQVDWRGGYNFSSKQAPDIQSHRFNAIDSSRTTGIYQIRGNADRVLRRGSFFTDEKGYTTGIDYSVRPIPNLKLKAGGMYQTTDRTFESWYYGLDHTTSATSYSFGQTPTPWYNLSTLLSDSLVLTADGSEGYYLFRDVTEGLFSVENGYYAGYTGAEWKILNDRLQLNAGIRYESYTRQLFDQYDNKLFTSGGYDYNKPLTGGGYAPIGDTITGPTFAYWLPSASINWSFSDKMKITTSYGKTIDRPAYRETTPYDYYDFENNIIRAGDASLLDATIQNYDLRWEYYPKEGEFIALGAFYKDMENVIESIDVTNISAQSGYRRFDFINSPGATIKGLEVEVRKNLSFIPWRPLQYFSVIANYALMQNRVEFFEVENEENARTFVPEGARFRPFVGAVPYVLNANLYFNQPEWGTTFSVLVNSIGQKLVATSAPRLAPIYELGRTTLDLVWNQRLNNWLSLKLGVQNLTDASITQYRDTNLDGQFDEGKIQEVRFKYFKDGDNDGVRYGYDYKTRSYRTGAYYSVGLTMEF